MKKRTYIPRTLVPDGEYREKVTFRFPITSRGATAGEAWVMWNTNQTVGNPNYITCDSSNSKQWVAFKELFARYKIYGLQIKMIPQILGQKSNNNYAIRSIQAGSRQQSGALSIGGVSLVNSVDYITLNPQQEYKKWCDVGAWNKACGFDWINTKDDYPIESHKCTYFYFDLEGFPAAPQNAVMAYLELKYYIAFKDRIYN